MKAGACCATIYYLWLYLRNALGRLYQTVVPPVNIQHYYYEPVIHNIETSRYHLYLLQSFQRLRVLLTEYMSNVYGGSGFQASFSLPFLRIAVQVRSY
jgi:hypothetical protein